MVDGCKPFWNYFPYDITSGRVHLDVCWIDQSASLPCGLKQGGDFQNGL